MRGRMQLQHGQSIVGFHHPPQSRRALWKHWNEWIPIAYRHIMIASRRGGGGGWEGLWVLRVSFCYSFASPFQLLLIKLISLIGRGFYADRERKMGRDEWGWPQLYYYYFIAFVCWWMPDDMNIATLHPFAQTGLSWIIDFNQLNVHRNNCQQKMSFFQLLLFVVVVVLWRHSFIRKAIAQPV